jgi:hypothetical protein
MSHVEPQMVKKVEGWIVYDKDGRWVFDTEEKARAHMGGASESVEEAEEE